MPAVADPDAFFRALGDHSVCGVEVFDLTERRYVYVNERRQRMLGQPRSESLALDVDGVRSLIHPDDLPRLRRQIHDLDQGLPGARRPLVYRMRHQSGAWLWMRAHHAAFARTAEGRLSRILTSLVDVTDLMEAKEAAQHFGQLAAHDLRAPARRIRQYVELAREGLAPGASAAARDEAARSIDGIDAQARRLRELSEGIQILTTMRAPDPPAEVALAEVVAEVLAAAPASARHRARLDPLPVVPGHRAALASLYSQLVENALIHANIDSPIRFTSQRKGATWVLGVETTGPTVPPEALESLFLPFRQGERNGLGTGLGLAICRRAVALHDGRIWMRSAAGQTHVQFTLSPGVP